MAKGVGDAGADGTARAPVEATTGNSAASAELEPFFRPSARDIAINQRRFGLAYLVLAIGVGVAVGLGIVLIGRGGSHQTSGPAGFNPAQGGELGAREIARHVMHEYKATSGADLVGVVGQRPSYLNVAMHDDLVQPSDEQGPKDTRDIRIGNGIMYLMCGTGRNCTVVGSQTPTRARALLIQQEALELTLRTFKNDSAVQTVTVLLPSVSTQAGSGQNLLALANRKDFASQISVPLSATIPRPGPYGDGDVVAKTAQTIRIYLQPDLYQYHADFLPDGTPTFILNPYPHGV